MIITNIPHLFELCIVCKRQLSSERRSISITIRTEHLEKGEGGGGGGGGLNILRKI
jgi:hypothetical protein